MEQPLVVTVKHGGEGHTRIWRDAKPMAIGHPFRWVLERDGKGIRIRDLADDNGNPSFGRISYVEPEILQSGMSVLLPNSAAAVRIRHAARLDPAFESRPNPNGNIQVYCCMGTWSLGSQQIAENYVGKLHENTAFEIRRAFGGYTLSAAVAGVNIETSAGTATLEEGESRLFRMEEIANLVIRVGMMSWIFSSFENVALPVLTAKDADQQLSAFKKSLGTSAVVLVLLGIAAAIWPAPKITDEPIPPQLTTIQLEKKLRRASAAPSLASTSKQASPNSRSATVQAFRAQALSSAMNGLMKGGMTKLLQDSEFMMGSDLTLAARSILNGQSKQLSSTAPLVGPMGVKSVAVASIGGEGLKVGNSGSGVGYGTGDHATVGGQGKSFVSLDTGASDVEEGLSKDEVGAVIHRHLTEVRYCYEAAMVRLPTIEGKLLIGFTISANGLVRSADVKNSSLGDSGLADCVLRRLSSWRFPQTKGGINVSVTYPFIFKSLGR